MTLSHQATELTKGLLHVLRVEYKDGLRDRHGLDHILERWKRAVEELESAESRELLAALRPLMRGYHTMPMGERQHVIVSVGQELRRRMGDAEETATPATSSFPPAGRPQMELDGDVMYIKGVGPQMAPRLKKFGIATVNDLLMHLPRRCEDRSKYQPIVNLRAGALETVKGKLGPFRTKQPKPGITIVEAPLSDNTGRVWLTWFNQTHVQKTLTVGQTLVATGKVEQNFGEFQMKSPELESGDDRIHSGRIVPIYPLTGSIQQKWMRKVQFHVVPTYAPKLPDPIPPDLLEAHHWPPKSQAVLELHWARDYEHREIARRRLAFEELFLLQMELAQQRATRELEPRTLQYALDQELLEDFLEVLPFPPTGAQDRVMREILGDLARNTPMNRLLQGDVGAGKTAVAAFAAWCAIQSGYQAAIMAPTEILAEQHLVKLDQMLGPVGIRVERLSGSLKKSEKRRVCELLAEGEINLLVGTHALIQDGVEFQRLGMVVVDEQHKFGVMQRTTLRQKGENPDLLVMTATPIPRTLALTLYGDLEVSRLDELPPGRRPIHSESVPFSERRRVYQEIRQQIVEGRQAYIICPLVEETEKVEATAAVEEAEILRRQVFPEFSVGLLHGRMKGAEKDLVMDAFRRGEHQILISTTVIEVGVDVPNATYMLVQDANRFGLAQLHQLRGRVGRGKHDSFCVFMGDAKSEDSARRLRAIARLSDGFDVAEEDLQIRGPGDFYGLRQSGFPEFKVADLLRDQDLLSLARKEAETLLAGDPELGRADHRPLRLAMDQRFKGADNVH